MPWHVYARVDVSGFADETIPEDERVFLSHWRGPYEDRDFAKKIAAKLQRFNKYKHVTWGTLEVKSTSFHKVIYPGKNKKLRVGAFDG